MSFRVSKLKVPRSESYFLRAFEISCFRVIFPSESYFLHEGFSIFLFFKVKVPDEAHFLVLGFLDFSCFRVKVPDEASIIPINSTV